MAGVCRILDLLFLTRTLPDMLILDNGPEFAGTAWDVWAAQHGVHPAVHSTREAGAERLYWERQREFRDECLNEHWFVTLQEAQLVIEARRREYNEERTHSTIGEVTPQEFIANYQNEAHLTGISFSFGLINVRRHYGLN
jgi:putative transposase